MRVQRFYFFWLRATLLVILLISSAKAQEVDLKNEVAALEESIQTVQSGSRSYEQKISFAEPAVIRYSYDETDQKGNRTNYAYEFNLADVDPYTVKEQTQKDVISVTVVARNKQRLIKTYKNELVQPYTAQINILAKDIDNARAIAEAIKKAIPLAEKVMAGRLNLTDYSAMTAWLVDNVKEVSLGDKSIAQTLTAGGHPGSLVFTRTSKDAKSSTEEVYTFNLADINRNSVAYKISGNQFSITVESVQKARYFSLSRDGQARPNTHNFEILTNNADEARDLKHVLTSAIPLAVREVEGSMPTVTSHEDGLTKLAGITTNLTYGPNEVHQSFDGGCLNTFTQIEKSPKSGTKNTFKFNWMDINPLVSNIEVSGEKVYISLQAEGGKKLIMQSVDDNFKGYESGFRLYMQDIEAARRAKVLIDALVVKCKEAHKDPFKDDAAGTTGYLMANIQDLTIDAVTLKQSLESVENDHNKFKYTTIQVTSKGSAGEMVYEFNLSDLNPSSITTTVRGKWLYVVVETDYKNKIIKAYKDGKIQPYANTLQFAVNDVDLGRSVVSALTKAVTAAKGK